MHKNEDIKLCLLKQYTFIRMMEDKPTAACSLDGSFNDDPEVTFVVERALLEIDVDHLVVLITCLPSSSSLIKGATATPRKLSFAFRTQIHNKSSISSSDLFELKESLNSWLHWPVQVLLLPASQSIINFLGLLIVVCREAGEQSSIECPLFYIRGS
jgi:hypothetical protein